MPLDNESRKVLSEACAGLPGKFQDGGFIVEGLEIANGSHVKTGFHRMFVFYCQVDSEGLFAKLEKPGAESISREATGEAMRSDENPLSTHHFWVKATITLRLGLQVILFNPEKGYGLIRADGDAQVQFL